MDELYYGDGESLTLARPGTSVAIDGDVIEAALKRIYERSFRPMTDIEANLFHEFCRTYNQAADKGFRQAAATPDDDFRQALRHNNAVFAAFKTHRLQNDVARQLLDANGNLKPFEQWKNDVQSITSHQCDRWLRTEYNTAVLRARQAANWQQFLREADVLPNLKWMPSTSPNPGADHQPFWNTVLPIGHPFWSQHRPGDRWGCKCDLTSTDEPATSPPSEGSGEANPQPGLDNNPGIDAKLFADSHPYIANAYPGAKEAVEKAVSEAERKGVYPAYPEIQRKLTEAENEIRKNKSFETAVVFTKDGNTVIDKRGKAFSVGFSKEEVTKMKDAVLTHNHPRGWKAKEGTLGRIGNSFSPEDIILAIKGDLAEVRAVTPTYTFAMKRPEKGWGVSPTELTRQFNNAKEGIDKTMWQLINRAGKNRATAIDRANAACFHLIWKQIAKKNGWEYKKAKTV